MNLGEKILEYRKKANLSQEDLAEKVGVTRQTISKWELNITCPDINQANKMCKIFNVSLDALTNNLILAKMDLQEKQGNKRFKVMICIFAIVFVLFIIETTAISFFYLGINKNPEKGLNTMVIMCELNKDSYEVAITYDSTNDIIMTGGSDYIFKKIIDTGDYTNFIELSSDIYNYFLENGGTCK
ncbi:MAG: helix-turn-helix transcriptional regulator [Bacilli bacterium]|nr:helix-turn-helix transcriptional regulator [Bacilli bacterium]